MSGPDWMNDPVYNPRLASKGDTVRRTAPVSECNHEADKPFVVVSVDWEGVRCGYGDETPCLKHGQYEVITTPGGDGGEGKVK